MARLLISILISGILGATIVNRANTGVPANYTVTATDTVIIPPVVIDTTIDEMLLVIIRDTASIAQLQKHINAAYTELFTFLGNNRLNPGKVLATYYTVESPFIFEAAVQVDSFPIQTKGRVKLDRIPGGRVFIAQFKGPYDSLAMAYNALHSKMLMTGATAKRVPFEVYLNDPMSVKSPFDLRTDVYQLLR
jgi:effector-binding domain-containing protein